VDFSGHANDSDTRALLCALEQELLDFTFFGNYREIDYT
jgi:hypothetical protein